MPNWCSCSMAVTGPQDELLRFKGFVEECVRKANTPDEEGNKRWSLWQVFNDACGFDPCEVAGDCGYNRGEITYVSMEDFPRPHVLIDYDSAWSSMVEGWDAILKAKFPSLKEVTRAEEEGCDYFINTDKDREFFKESVFLRIDSERCDIECLEDYYESVRDALDAAQECLHKKSRFRDVDSLRAYVKRRYKDSCWLTFEEYCDY